MLAAVVIVTAGLLDSFNLLAARHRDQVRHELQKVLGQDVTFDRLEINLFGRPGFAAKEFRIADDARFAATPVVQTRELVFGVSLWNLLWRRVVITSLTFHEPDLQVITDEAGLLNLTALINRKAELRRFPRLRPPASSGPAERRQFPVSFAIEEVRIKSGRVDYVDRSVKPAAELRIRNISMSVRGFELDEPTRIHIDASLAEGLGQDVRIDGRLTPPEENRSWLQRAIDLNVQFDSLHVPVVARAIAALRDKIPAELDVTGPMALQVRMRGTPERPRLENVTLEIPLFGSSEYNAIVNGDVYFTERRTWEDAEIKGKATVEPLPLARLSRVKAFAQLLPVGLISEGNLGLYSRFEGTWQDLRLGVLVRAQAAELRYKDWFHKPANAPAAIRARISRAKQVLRFHDSELVLGDNRLNFSGAIDRGPTPRLHLRLRNQSGWVPGWARFFTTPQLEAQAGNVEMDLTLAASLVPADGDWSLDGRLNLADAVFKHKPGDRRIDKVGGQIAFSGKRARFKNASFRLGSSTLFFDGEAANWLEPRWLGTIRSPDLLLSDLPVINMKSPVRLKNTDGAGAFHFDDRGWRLTASVTSPEGHLNELPFQDLRANIEFSPSGLTFKDLEARTFSGRLRSEGHWTAAASNGSPLEFSSQVDKVEMREILARLFPPFRNRFEGRLDGHGSFQVNDSDTNTKGFLKGLGEVSIQQGAIKDFNLISQLLLKGSGATISAASTARLSMGLAALASRPDTPFESLKADFTVEEKRVSSQNLVFITPDYTITAAGWVGFDRTAQWNGSLVLSPRLTQEVQRDYRIIRYLLDRRGRLAISFRADGKMPNLAVRLDNRALAQALRSGKAQTDGGADRERGDSSRDEKNWLPDALERLLRGG